MTDAGRPILIAGPTASGKSALALKLAADGPSVIINADSMQVYADLRILTARPDARDEAAVPHRLYGHLPAAERYSVAQWLADAEREIEAARVRRERPIIVGGTGLYFKALTEGLSPVPPIPDGVRTYWRGLAAAGKPGDLHGELGKRDPVMAARLDTADIQRVTRALEVVDATGVSLAHWQTVRGRAVLALEACAPVVVRPPRDELASRCDARFDAMLEAGAIEEVAALLAAGLPTELPAMKALGVAALSDFLRGRASLDEARARGKLETRQYIKRQETWFNRHMIAWQRYEKT